MEIIIFYKVLLVSREILNLHYLHYLLLIFFNTALLIPIGKIRTHR